MSALIRYTDTIIVPAPRERVFGFYTRVENLRRMISPSLVVRVVHAEEPLRQGSKFEFDVGPRSLPISVKWVAEISHFDAPASFEDRLVNGPFSSWVHRHDFVAREDGTTALTDTLEVGAGRGMIGKAIQSLLLDKNLEDLYKHRLRVLEEEFGACGKVGG